jgi:SlyX protein
MPGDPLEARFVALETKVAYQDKLIAELNEVLVERTQELATLARRLEALERFVREPADETVPPHERPPHY